jgi:hypothetical protein
VKEYLDDYPEAKPTILHFAEQIVAKKLADMNLGDFGEIKSGLAKVHDELEQNRYETQVVTGIRQQDGTWLDGHPDAFKIMATPEFKEFWTSEAKLNPRIREYGAAETIAFLHRFKKERAAAAAAKHDQGGSDAGRQLKDMASGAPESGTRTTGARKKKDEEKSPEELFAEGAK